MPGGDVDGETDDEAAHKDKVVVGLRGSAALPARPGCSPQEALPAWQPLAVVLRKQIVHACCIRLTCGHCLFTIVLGLNSYADQQPCNQAASGSAQVAIGSDKAQIT